MLLAMITVLITMIVNMMLTTGGDKLRNSRKRIIRSHAACDDNGVDNDDGKHDGDDWR